MISARCGRFLFFSLSQTSSTLKYKINTKILLKCYTYIFYNGHMTKWNPIRSAIVSITKFSIAIGHPRVTSYVIGTWSRGCPITAIHITTFCNWIAVIGRIRCTRVNQFHLNVFFFAFHGKNLML